MRVWARALCDGVTSNRQSTALVASFSTQLPLYTTRSARSMSLSSSPGAYVVYQTHPTTQTRNSDITICQFTLYTTVVTSTFSSDPCFVADICNKTRVEAERPIYDCRIELTDCDIRMVCLDCGVRLRHDFMHLVNSELAVISSSRTIRRLCHISDRLCHVSTSYRTASLQLHDSSVTATMTVSFSHN